MHTLLQIKGINQYVSRIVVSSNKEVARLTKTKTTERWSDQGYTLKTERGEIYRFSTRDNAIDWVLIAIAGFPAKIHVTNPDKWRGWDV